MSCLSPTAGFARLPEQQVGVSRRKGWHTIPVRAHTCNDHPLPSPSPSLLSLPRLPLGLFPCLQLPRNEKVTEAKGSPMSTKKVKTERGESRYGPAKKVPFVYSIPEVNTH